MYGAAWMRPCSGRSQTAGQWFGWSPYTNTCRGTPGAPWQARVQKIIEQLGQLPALDLILHTAGAGNTVLQLVQGKSQFTATTLFSVQFSPSVDGDPACDFSEESREDGRAMGRHGVPSVVICIVDALLRILPVDQDIVRNIVEVAAILRGGLCDRCLGRLQYKATMRSSSIKHLHSVLLS